MRGYLYVALSFAAFFLSYYSRLAWSVLSTYSSLRPTPYEDGLIFSIFFAAYIAVQIPAGLVSDAIGPKKVLVMALLGLAASSVLGGAADTIWLEYLGSVLMGFSAGWIYPTTIKLLSTNFEGKDLARAMGYYSLAWPISIILLGVGLPTAAEDLGWRWGYYLIGVASFAIALAAAVLMEDVRRRDNGGLNLRVLASRNVALLSIGGFLFYYAYWAFAFYAYDYLRSIGMSGILAGEIYSMTAAAGIASTVITGYLIGRIGLWRTFLIAIPLYGLTILGFAVLRAPIWLAAVALAMGFFRFMVTPANSTLASVIGGPGRSGSVTGAANFFWQLSGVIAGSASPLIFVSMGYASLWGAMALMVFASLVPYVMLRDAMGLSGRGKSG
ncbi:MFS transporter [Conexivisphaera calida]|uniref:MFS transporter n=1 Tax=Conexivisphaera calida TaxID=1874277 RepID=UPI00157B3262|nr:MFS transporter [Conexivisphaera calida]